MEFHRGFVRFHGEQRLLGHGVAHLDQHFNHGHVLEVADVGDADVQSSCCSCGSCCSAGAAAGFCWFQVLLQPLRKLCAGSCCFGEQQVARRCLPFPAPASRCLRGFGRPGPLSAPCTTPAWLEGISIEALSALTVIKRLLDLDGVARFDQHFDHAHAVEVANVRDFDFYQVPCVCLLPIRRTGG